MDEPIEISAINPDWNRETVRCFWDPGPKLIRAIRRYQSAKSRGGFAAKITSKYWVLVHRFWSVVTQSEIHLHMEIGGGLMLPHPTGIILHPDCKLGVNCLIFQQVTISNAVDVGGHVDFGAGAKILGPLTIGDQAAIGANAVVTKNIKAGETWAGIPARPLREKSSG
ncbi:MAG: serine acetyltransferase [Cognatishimia sp.]